MVYTAFKTRKTMDRLTKEQRYKNMSANKGKGTKLELLFGKLLWNAGVRYRKNDKTVFGKPDFVIRKMKIAIFCDGEFWHGKDFEERKSKLINNKDYWVEKIEENIKRDNQNDRLLRQIGWIPVHFWTKDIEESAEYCIECIEEFIEFSNNGKEYHS